MSAYICRKCGADVGTSRALSGHMLRGCGPSDWDEALAELLAADEAARLPVRVRRERPR